MTPPKDSQSTSHIADLLPGFVNGTLPRLERDAVLRHVQHCPACQMELRAWEAIRDGTRLAVTQAPGAPSSVLDYVLARIDTQPYGAMLTSRRIAAANDLPRTTHATCTPFHPEDPMTSLAISPLPVPAAPGTARRHPNLALQLPIARWLSFLAAAVLLLATVAGIGLLGAPDQSRLGSVLPWQPVSGADVPMYRGNAARTGEMPGPGPASKPDMLWQVQTGGQIQASPALVDGVLYVGSADGVFHAFDAVTGEERWHVDTGASDTPHPAVADGRVFVGDANPGQGDGHGNLFVFDAATGAEAWRLQDVQAGSPLVADGVLYLGNRDGFLLALDVTDGTERWRTETGLLQRGVTMADGVIFAPTRDGFIYAVDAATGEERWHYETEGGIPGTIAAADGMIFEVTFDGPADQLYALDAATGEERWRFKIGPRLQSVAVSDGVVYVPAGDGSLYALDAEKGTNLWRFALHNPVVAAPVLADGMVYVSSSDPTLYAVDAKSGKEQWHVDLEGPIGASAVVSGGVIYVGSQSGTLYALSDTADAPPVVIPAADDVATSGSAQFLWQATNGSAPIDAVGGLAQAPDGAIWVPETNANRILIFSPDGVFKEAWGTPGPSEGEFDFILEEGGGGYGDLAFDGEGNVYVLDSGNYRVQKFDRTRRFLTTIGAHGSGEGQFLGPVTIAMDAQDNLYVADDLRGDIQKFASDGTYLATIASRGKGDGQTECIPDFGVAADGTLYVPDCWRHQVQVFAPDGSYLDTWGSEGKGDGQFEFPSTVAFDPAGRVYIGDSGNHRVQVFTPNGDFVTAWGQFGSGEGDFNGSGSILLDSVGNAYVGDGNGRIQKFQLKPPLVPVGAATPED